MVSRFAGNGGSALVGELTAIPFLFAAVGMVINST